VALPDRTEGSLVSSWLSENQFEPVYRPTMDAVASEIRTRAFNLMIADATWAVSKAFQTPDRGPNTAAPTILVGDATDRRTTAMDGQAMYLTRPIELAVLSCFVSMALMDDKPVRRSPRKEVPRFDALVNNEPAAIVDVSAEGFRLELPRARRLPPPFFGVRIPLVGVAIIASRRWAMSTPCSIRRP
jgi:DNA-binding response OmpR family regulator